MAGGRSLVPREWIAAMSTPAFTAAQTGKGNGYGYQTWIVPAREPSFALFGVRGQFTFIDPVRRLVMVNTAVRTDPRDRRNAETDGALAGPRGQPSHERRQRAHAAVDRLTGRRRRGSRRYGLSPEVNVDGDARRRNRRLAGEGNAAARMSFAARRIGRRRHLAGERQHHDRLPRL